MTHWEHLQTRAPPHTRGSTQPDDDAGAGACGSPAHAGIDPRTGPLRPPAPWLPRTRGDRPGLQQMIAGSVTAPPHTRGSTDLHAGRVVREVGSPAHAGIDPMAVEPRMRSLRLPRTRGDRPCPRSRSGSRASAPPHTRGSTHGEHRRFGRARGSPAHAGIDLCPVPLPPLYVRLPRTRGDRPTSTDHGSHKRSAPPHTRGSTRIELRVTVRATGSPAHAGIDPRTTARTATSGGLPRTRGDRPCLKASPADIEPAPPHTRGSTLIAPEPRSGPVGSPAHAGIDPSARRAPRLGWRLPRTRGDRPCSIDHASSIRVAPPHTRGSTFWRSISRPPARGSPAHAGIDPASSSACARSDRLPRTRGDRPSTSSLA